MSLLLGEATGTSTEYWLNLEQNYRFDVARAKKSDDLVAQKSKLFSTLPIRELLKRQWLDVHFTKRKISARDLKTLQDSVARYYFKSTFTEVEDIQQCALFRRSTENSASIASIMAWLQKSREVAKKINVTGTFSQQGLRMAIPQFRVLTTEREDGIRSVRKLLLDCGVRLVFIPHLQKTKIDGAALWLSESEPVISLSLRYARIDSFWFTLFHEIAHLVLHKINQERVDEQIEENPEVKEEREADTFAQEALLPLSKFHAFKSRADFSRQSIEDFSQKEKIHPSILVGRLQFEKLIGFYQHQKLFDKFKREALWDVG
jgi:HTH-type transcriptional regulator/antitoxin HigA